MQLKGLIKIFTIALILISLFQLSFTLVVNNFEKSQASKVRSKIQQENPGMSKAELDIAAEDKLRFVLDSLSTKEIMNLGVTKYTYQEAKKKQIILGPDM